MGEVGDRGLAHRRGVPRCRLLGDLEAHRERGHDLRHVAEVARRAARAAARARRRLVERQAGARGVRDRQTREGRVRPRLLVWPVGAAGGREGVVRDDLEPGAGLEGRALGDRPDLFDDDLEMVAVARAQHEVRGGEIGDDVRRLPAVGDHAVYAHVVAQVLAQRVDPAEEPQHGVERVDALLRSHRCVRGLPVVRVAVADEREAPGELGVGIDEREVRSRVRRERHVHALEDACLEEADLPAAALLRGCPDDLDRPGELVERGLRAQACAQVRDGDEVVATGVADLGKCVVLGQEGDGRRGRGGPVASAIGRPRARASAGARAEVGLDAADAALDDEAPALEGVGEDLRRVALLEVELRMGVDVAGDRDQLVGLRVDRDDDVVPDGGALGGDGHDGAPAAARSRW